VDRTHTREIRKAQAPQPSAMAFGPLVGGWCLDFFIFYLSFSDSLNKYRFEKKNADFDLYH